MAQVQTSRPKRLLPQPPGALPTASAELHGLEGLLRKPDPKITLSLPEDAELIDPLHKLTGKMPKFAQFNPPPATPTPAPSPSPSAWRPRRHSREAWPTQSHPQPRRSWNFAIWPPDGAANTPWQVH